MQCPVCEHPSASLKYSLSDRFFQTTDEEFPLYECSGCGLLFQDPASVESRLSDFYPADYWWSPEGPLQKLEGRYREWMLTRDHLRFVTECCPPEKSSRLLDVGCGSGLFPELAKRAGFDAWGLESAPRAVELARGRGLDRIVCGDLESLLENGEKFDLLTLFHVPEHLPDPFRFLKRVQGLLERPADLIVQVPNRSSWQARIFRSRWYGLDCPRHICNYTLYSVLALLGRAGYRIHRVRHFSLRDNAPAIASSLLPSLDPLGRRVRSGGQPGGSVLGEAARTFTYAGAVALSQPLAWVESLFGRGGTVMIHSTLD